MRPDPKLWGEKWVVDLRAAGFGQRYRLGPSTLSREEAVHVAYELLQQLQGKRMAEPEQRDMFADAGPELFAAAIDRWKDQRRYDSDGGKAWVALYARLVRRDLGSYRLQDFAPPSGNDRLAAYVRELERREQAGRTIRNRLSIAEQVCRYAVERGWLPATPLHPRLPPKSAPVYDWISEPMFRALRGAVFESGGARSIASVEWLSEGKAIYVARRRVYLSWLFYTGVHNVDADRAIADHLFLDGGGYIRHNTKSSRSVKAQQFEMPEPLIADLRELQALIGRPFYPGEAFAGGHWRNVCKVMQTAARRLGFPRGANPRILRRSYAREMFVRGYEPHEVADRMGHVDLRMLREIYVQTPRPAGSHHTRWVMPDASARPPSPSGMARVLRMDRP